MWYILIIVVTANHIHQKTVIDSINDQAFRDRATCEAELKSLKKLKPKYKVRQVHMACHQADPRLNYFFGENDVSRRSSTR